MGHSSYLVGKTCVEGSKEYEYRGTSVQEPVQGDLSK